MYNKREAIKIIRKNLKIDSTGRWYWRGRVNNRGYPVVSIPGYKSPQLVSRVIHWSYKEPVDPEWQVDHKNGNILDITPSNLEAVPKSENMRRAAKKGSFRGERNGNSKLTEELVSLIKIYYHEFGYSQKRITEELGVPRSTVSNICRGKTWKHVTVDWIAKPGKTPEQNRIETV